MQQVRIIHWKPAEAGPLVELVRAAGFEAAHDDGAWSPAIVRAIRVNPPGAVLIDLSRMPSHGREIAVWLRGNKSTRNTPIVFVNGEAEKVARIRDILPDAIYATVDRLDAALKCAFRKRSAVPVVPTAMMDRYKEKSTARKLGIGSGSGVGLVDPPRDYATALGDLPENVELIEDPDTIQPVTLWFVHDPDNLLTALRRMRTVAAKTKLWIVWRKGSGNGVTQNSIRETALESGLVDYKICSVDNRWSAMLFAPRKT